MPKLIKIDFISDIACPWCAVGLHELEKALTAVQDVVDVELDFEPFELNPDMPPEGQNIIDYVVSHYGSTKAESVENRKVLRERADAVGFSMPLADDSRMYNTRDAHRLLYWARTAGHQLALKHRLFEANFTDGLNVSDHHVLLDVAVEAGLDRQAASKVLASGQFNDEVSREENLWRTRGISSVPTIVIDGRYRISGGQTAEMFEQALRKIAAES